MPPPVTGTVTTTQTVDGHAAVDRNCTDHDNAERVNLREVGRSCERRRTDHQRRGRNSTQRAELSLLPQQRTGRQHVQRTETKVELLFDLANSPSLTEAQRALAQSRLGRPADSDGVLHMTLSQAGCSQPDNRPMTARFQQPLASAQIPASGASLPPPVWRPASGAWRRSDDGQKPNGGDRCPVRREKCELFF